MDWSSKKILAERAMIPRLAKDADSNPRGGARGGRGILWHGHRLFAATYNTLEIFDQKLNKTGEITHNYFAGIHEICSANDLIWVSSTAIDAAVAVDAAGEIQSCWWPRESKKLQQRYGLKAVETDHRTNYGLRCFSKTNKHDESHTHLNAIQSYQGHVYALLNRFGVVYNIGTNEILIEDERLVGAHNLLFFDDQCVVNDTRGKKIRIYDMHGVCKKTINLMDLSEIKKIHLATKKIDVDAKPLFLRGLQLSPDKKSFFVGISPASIVEIDLETVTIRSFFQYSTRPEICVHGLFVPAK